MSPTGRTAALIALLAVAALIAPAVVVLVAICVLAGAVLVDASSLRGMGRPERSAPDTLARGEPAALSVDGPAVPWSVARVRQAVPPDLRLEPSSAPAPLRGRLTALRRGRHVLPAAAARVEGPLRLVARYVDGDAEHPVHVYPDLPAARRMALAVQRGAYRDEGTHGRGPLGLGTEFEAVREYSPDDDIRQVNWRATARLGRPMSNDYRIDQDRDVIAVIDAGRLTAAPLGGGTVLDAALDATAALAAAADVLNDRFGAVAFDSEVRSEVRPRRAGGVQAMRALYDLEPRATDSDYQRAFQRVGSSKRAFVALFTDMLEEVAARSLLEAAPMLARRHAVAIVTVRDPELHAATTTQPRQIADAYRSAVAIEVLRDRRIVAARLQRLGVGLVEADAGDLGGACVREYLRAKSLARL